MYNIQVYTRSWSQFVESILLHFVTMFDDAMMQSCCIHLFWKNILLRNIIKPSLKKKKKHMNVPPTLIPFFFPLLPLTYGCAKGQNMTFLPWL